LETPIPQSLIDACRNDRSSVVNQNQPYADYDPCQEEESNRGSKRKRDIDEEEEEEDIYLII
jgi:hypothetical protein